MLNALLLSAALAFPAPRDVNRADSGWLRVPADTMVELNGRLSGRYARVVRYEIGTSESNSGSYLMQATDEAGRWDTPHNYFYSPAWLVEQRYYNRPLKGTP